MNVLFKIAKNELRNLVYSPVAWFLLVIFFIECGYFYFFNVAELAHLQDSRIANSPYFRDWDNSLTRQIFLDPDGIFRLVVNNVYLFIPLLTMSVFSREYSGGTYKLLYSSRVKVYQVVIGKYLGLMLFNLAFLMTVLVFILCGSFSIEQVEYGMLLSAAAAFFLLIGAYSAIGLFMSTLSTYQIVSAIGTFAILFILNNIGSLWQQYDVIRDLTSFLSIAGRTLSMVFGLVKSKDVIYFLLIIFMFLGYTLVKVRSSTAARPWFVQLFRYLAITIITVVTGYITSLPSLSAYWDVTKLKTETIHPNTLQVLRELDEDEPLTVTLYSNLFSPETLLAKGLPKSRNAYLTGLWEPYLRFKPDIHFKYVYYYDYDTTLMGNRYYTDYPGKDERQIARMIADQQQLDFSLFIPPHEIKQHIDLSAEGKTVVMLLEYKGQKEFLRVFGGSWPDEVNVSAALKRLMRRKRPKVTFTTGNWERSPFKTGEREFSKSTMDRSEKRALINTGFDVDTVTLASRDIPPDTRVLVVADPKSSLNQAALSKIRAYVNDGGNLLVMTEPKKQGVVNEVLEQTSSGIRALDGLIVEPTWWESPDKVYAALTEKPGLDLADERELLGIKEMISFRNKNPHLKTFGLDSLGVIMPGVVGLSSDSTLFTVKPLLLPRANLNWLKAGPLVADSTNPSFNEREGDKRGVFPVSLLASRKFNGRTQKIILCGDADFSSNFRLGIGSIPAAMYSFLVDNEYPVYTPRSRPVDTLLTISGQTATIQKILFVWIVPGLLAILGTVILIRRKRQ